MTETLLVIVVVLQFILLMLLRLRLNRLVGTVENTAMLVFELIKRREK